jgi:hypothetical protein
MEMVAEQYSNSTNEHIDTVKSWLGGNGFSYDGKTPMWVRGEDGIIIDDYSRRIVYVLVGHDGKSYRNMGIASFSNVSIDNNSLVLKTLTATFRIAGEKR